MAAPFSTLGHESGMQPVNTDHVTVGGGVSDPPLVTVIIPVYNRLQYLKQAIESALGQTHSRVQVVVVDDGSPLDPAPVLAEFGPRVELHRKANGGLASARNLGIARAAGEYLLFLDDDDFLEPTAIETLLRALRAAGAAWAAGRYAYVNAAGQPLQHGERYRYESGDVYGRMVFNNLMGAPSVVLARADVVRSLGCFDEGFLLSEDWDFWLTMARDYPLCAVQEVVSNYRVHSQQISKQWARHFEFHLRVLSKHRERARPGYASLFTQGIARMHLRYGDGLYVNGRPAEAREQWERARRLDPRLGGRSLYFRMAKSRLPRPLLTAARRLAGVWRGLPLSRRHPQYASAT